MIQQLLNNLLYPQLKTILVIAVILLSSIFVFFIILIAKYQRKYVRIQKDLTKAEVDRLEKERQRMASDLHDSLGPLLSAVKLHINSLDTQIAGDLELIEKAGQYIDNMMDNIRAVANSLSPKVLARKGLVVALEDLAEGAQETFLIRIRYEPNEIPKLSEDNELHIYRIVQEIIHNTVKHARATQLLIKLYPDKQTLVLLTADDGQGFDTDNQKENGSGLGLRNIESRAGILNGTVELTSKVNEGTKYIFEFPLNNLVP